MARAAFFKLISLMGYGSAKQYAGRRAFAMYTNLCVPRPDEESAFWKDGMCSSIAAAFFASSFAHLASRRDYLYEAGGCQCDPMDILRSRVMLFYPSEPPLCLHMSEVGVERRFG